MTLTSYMFRPPFIPIFRDLLYGGYIDVKLLINAERFEPLRLY